ncbi:hypothetical protein BDR22DRAFT_861075 [Usnea florida]
MPLAYPLQRRQDVQSSSESSSPSTSPYLSTFYFNNNNTTNNDNNNNQLLDKSFYDPSSNPHAKLALDIDLNYAFSSNDSYYIDSRQSTPSDHFNFGIADTQYMQNNSSQYPQLRLQQSDANGLPSATTPPPMVEDFSQQSWNTFSDHNSYLAPSPQQQYNPHLNYRGHKRLPSDSSVASVGPDSPYTQSSAYPQIVDPDAQSIQSAHLENWDPAYSNIGQCSKPAYAPSANSDLFYNQAFQNFLPASQNGLPIMTTQTAINQSMNQQRGLNMNGSQNTSRRTFGGRVDSSSDIRSNTPQLDRTMSDVYQDELYNPAMAQSAPSTQPRQQQAQGNTASPHRTAFNDLLQAATTNHLTARSASPAVNASRQRSPFRESSQYAADGVHSNPSSPAGATRVNTATHMRLQQKQEADAHAYAQHHAPLRHEYLTPAKTISPKEAQLNYDNTEDDAKVPLFPPIKSEPRYSSQNSNGVLHRGNTDESSSNDQSYPSMATSRRESSASSANHQSGSGFSLMPPSVPALPQQYPFISESRRQSSSMRSSSDQVPEFPASLTSMESTKSETGQAENVKLTLEADQSVHSPPSSQEAPIQRPVKTTASSGSYTCTSLNCHERFDTAAKLQKHRREAHNAHSRYASTPTTPTSATLNSQAAANNVSRNNAPGPHKCEKTNPQTGKPCNSSFSRSYDLTRHEETIHNNRKQKVRCHLCTEEKTFSRNDALTRHMRVVHPDIDFPGKSRRARNEGADVVRQRIETGRGGR